KAIIDSAFGLDPNDKSPEARARRTISLGQLEGMAFITEIGIEKGSGDYSDKNVVTMVITKDKKDWHPVEQPPRFNGGGAPPASTPPQSAPPVQRLSAIEDQWQRDATAAAIAAARGVAQMGGPIPPGTPIGRLSDTEWGWITSGVLFAWISKRAEQAAAEQLDTEQTIRLTAHDPEPWDAGA